MFYKGGRQEYEAQQYGVLLNLLKTTVKTLNYHIAMAFGGGTGKH